MKNGSGFYNNCSNTQATGTATSAGGNIFI